MKQPNFNKEELYLIERQFDSAYSLMDKEFRNAAEQFILLKCEEGNDKQKKLDYLAGIILRYAEASTKFREISNKCEKVRRE